MKPRFSPAFLREKAIKDQNQKTRIANEKWIKDLKSLKIMNPKIEEYLKLMTDLQKMGIK